MRVKAALVCTLVLPLAGCRDGLGPWEVPRTLADTGDHRLTFSTGHDVDPAWIAADTLIYTAESFPGLPTGRGLLLRLPVTGGIAEIALPAVQTPALGALRWLASPALSPDRQRVAYLDLASVRVPAPSAQADSCTILEPLLDSAFVRVRDRTSSAPPSSGYGTAIRFAGPDPQQVRGGPGPYTVRLWPFQQLFAEQSLVATSLDWDPDGNRLVFSDGSRLWLWTPGGGDPTPVPGTDGGMMPAWSPGGDRIAFARTVRTDSTASTCAIRVGTTTQFQRRWAYATSAPRVVLVRPDGSDPVDLGPGEEPAWSVDGTALYVRRNAEIHRQPVSGGASSAVPGTAGGRQPAISPDGRWLAFVRNQGNPIRWDVWVARLR